MRLLGHDDARGCVGMVEWRMCWAGAVCSLHSKLSLDMGLGSMMVSKW